MHHCDLDFQSKFSNFNRFQTSAVSNHLAKILSKAVHSFGLNIVHRQKDRLTHTQTNCIKNIISWMGKIKHFAISLMLFHQQNTYLGGTMVQPDTGHSMTYMAMPLTLSKVTGQSQILKKNGFRYPQTWRYNPITAFNDQGDGDLDLVKGQGKIFQTINVKISYGAYGKFPWPTREVSPSHLYSQLFVIHLGIALLFVFHRDVWWGLGSY